MLNQAVIVGRLIKNPELIEENGKETSSITLAVPRSYKNEQGEYQTDFIECILWNGIAKNTTEYCRKGDLIGVRGRIEGSYDELKTIMRIVAEKVSFLSSANTPKEEN